MSNIALDFSDTDGTDGGGGDDGGTREHFIERFKEIAARSDSFDEMVNSFADCVDEYIAGLSHFLTDEEGYRAELLKELGLGRKVGPKLTLINGKSE